MKQATREDKVAEFHKAMGIDVNADARTSLLDLRAKLINEECREVTEELAEAQRCLNFGHEYDWTKLLKELADLQYVLSGTLVSLKKTNNVDFDVVFNRVHESNMSKLDDNGKPIRNSDGKVMKGPNYKEPYLKDLI